MLALPWVVDQMIHRWYRIDQPWFLGYIFIMICTLLQHLRLSEHVTFCFWEFPHFCLGITHKSNIYLLSCIRLLLLKTILDQWNVCVVSQFWIRAGCLFRAPELFTVQTFEKDWRRELLQLAMRSRTRWTHTWFIFAQFNNSHESHEDEM